MSIESVMPSNHLVLCRPFSSLPSVFPSIRAFSSELALRIRWPFEFSASASVLPLTAAAAKSLQSCLTLQPHRWQPTRLPHPWDSPGKNTGVGCHFLLQCMKVKSESEVSQSCPTLRDPMDCSLPGSSVHGIFQARVEWGAIAFSASTEYSGLISFKIDWLDLLAVQGMLKGLVQHHSSKASILQCSAFFMVQFSHLYMTTGKP